MSLVVLGVSPGEPGFLFGRETTTQLVRDFHFDVFSHLQNLPQFSVELSSPQLRVLLDIHHPDPDRELFTAHQNSSHDQCPDAQLIAHGLWIGVEFPVAKGRGPRDHF